MSAQTDGMPPEDSEEERTRDSRYTRSRDSRPVYELDVGPLHWAAYDAYDEHEGFECHWHKVCAHGACAAANAPDAVTAAREDDPARLEWAEAVVDRALKLLRAWQAHQHQLLLPVRQVRLSKWSVGT